ncbi:thiamine phosphate synthase [Actinopolymorpha singaporensis]|uniref:Thiamine-phosphate synthase n=1 Tax=Actinopolymorpha singaporensis TaxID=117157 RepID=A0A1H1Y888_9ACTN|nr:thiamine phosphate synthase [Actinopolymorpha singaporensis]SDT17632.1 thiamine-phosphate pyrophosphorylase [Actinopolymorpha singaporensis]
MGPNNPDRSLDLSLYLVTDTALCGPRGVAATVREAVAGGVSAVQLRDPGATTRDLLRTGAQVREVLAGTGVPLFVNDRADVAHALGADGVHLGQSDLPPEHARDLLGPRVWIGLSAHTSGQLDRALALPRGTVNYLGVGPVFPQATKPDAASPLGLAFLAELVATAAAGGLPSVAIGGIGPDNAAAVRATGVAGIAVVSAVCGRPDPAAAARVLRTEVR